jgi:hypothetical protein
MRARLLILLIVLMFVLLASFVARYWSQMPMEHQLRPSDALAVYFVGYTNSDAVIEVTNRSNQGIHLDWGCAIYTRYAPDDSDGHFIDGCMITNGSPLAARTSIRVTFPAPTNGLYWRVSVSGEADQARRVEGWMENKKPFSSRHLDILFEPREAHSDWIAPPAQPPNESLQRTAGSRLSQFVAQWPAAADFTC